MRTKRSQHWVEPPTASVHTWIVPGVKLHLYSRTATTAIHYAEPGARETLCGIRHAGYMSRGVAFAKDVYIQTRPVAGVFRRLTAKEDCIRCMESYTTNMRKFKT
jgi:hypothetical protein